MITFNVHSALMKQDCSHPWIRKHQIQSNQGSASLGPGACSASRQGCAVLPLKAWALGTEALGNKVVCLLVSAPSPELPPSFSEHGSGEMGPGPVCFYSYPLS